MGGQLVADPPAPGPRSWLRLLGPACSQAVLVVLCTLGIWAIVVPVFTGLHPVAVTSGSMQPALAVGDVVLLDEDAGVSEGRVATFTRWRGGARELITHRVAGRDDGAWRTRGDANGLSDPWRVEDDDIVGIGRLAVPLVGLPVVWAERGRVDLLATSALALGVLVWSAGTLRRRPRGRHLRSTPAVRIERAGRLLFRSALLVALVSATASQRPAAAAFVGDTTNTGSSVAAATISPPPNLAADARCVLLVADPRVDLSWDPVVGATAYTVHRDAGSGFTYLKTVTGTTHTDTSVAGLSTYSYLVRAVMGTWTSGDSDVATVTTSLCV